MIFVILNAALVAYFIWTSMNVNTKNQGVESSIINVLLLDAAAAIIMFFAVICTYSNSLKILDFLIHMALFLVMAVFLEISGMFVNFAKKKKSNVVLVIKIILLVAGAYIVFARLYTGTSSPYLVKQDADAGAFFPFTRHYIDDNSVFTISSDFVFSGELAKIMPFTWLNLYIAVYVFICPTLGFLIMLLTAENYNSRLLLQKSLLCFASVVFSWVGLAVIYYLSMMLPMMRTLFMYIIGVMSVLILHTVTQDKIFDSGIFFSSILTLVIRYLIPAAAGAVIYVALRPLYSVNSVLYNILVFLGLFLVMMLGRLISSVLMKVVNYRSSQYEEEFEKALASIDYENELSDISQEFFKAFQDNMQATTMTVLIDSGTGEYSTAFNSEGKTCTITKSAKARETLMNNDIYILFREEVENNYILQPVMEDIEKIFYETESEALIVLHEGHHILGLLLLGEKRTGSSYDEYDKHVLDKFYSYFFVFGYYMKNIANASVIGTVNREIRMSSQIITSIQENMDYIKNPKVDVGYLMVPAHNIGGEFVDLIRLNDTSHIMVIGSLSGKGISASMSMVILKSIIRTFLADTHDFKKLIQKVNAFIRFNLPPGTFFSGVFCLMDFASDTMYYVNCGIPTLLEYSKTYNNVIEIQGKGYVLGFVKDITPLIKVKQIKLVSGDMLAISTSGLINSHSLRGEQFGKERIKQTIMDNYTYPASRITKFTYDNLQRFMSKELEDDITILVVKYLGKDGVAVSEAGDSAQEHIADHADSFDADALINAAIEDSENFEPSQDEGGEKDSVSETASASEFESVVDSEIASGEETGADIESAFESDVGAGADLADLSGFADDMFNDDFSNINEVSDTEIFSEKTDF